MKKTLIKPKDAWITLGVIALAGFGLILHSNRAFNEETEKIEAGFTLSGSNSTSRKGVAWVEIEFGSTTRRFEGDVNGNTYSLETALFEVATLQNIPFRVSEGVIEAANKADAGGQWAIYRNGALLTVPLHTLTIRKGDTYTLRYTK